MMTPIKSGPALVKALKLAGTGEAKLDVAREALKFAHAEGRVASAGEVVAHLRACGTNPDTVAKAETLMLTGMPPSRVAPEVPIEDRLDDESHAMLAPPLFTTEQAAVNLAVAEETARLAEIEAERKAADAKRLAGDEAARKPAGLQKVEDEVRHKGGPPPKRG